MVSSLSRPPTKQDADPMNLFKMVNDFSLSFSLFIFILSDTVSLSSPNSFLVVFREKDSDSGV